MKPTELCIYGDIGNTYWFEGVTANDVRLGLKDLDTDAAEHTVRINSTGGLVDEGLAMMNILRAHAASMKLSNPQFSLNTVVDGYCMSAATCPFMAGDNRQVALGGVVLIHDAWNYTSGNAADLRKTADDLDKLSDNAATVYAALCTAADVGTAPRDAAYFRNLMRQETYLIGDEIVNCGLATAVDKSLEAMLFKDLTPEKMKGRYVELMTKRQERRVYSRARDSAVVLTKNEALKALAHLEIELGMSLSKV